MNLWAFVAVVNCVLIVSWAYQATLRPTQALRHRRTWVLPTISLVSVITSVTGAASAEAEAGSIMQMVALLLCTLAVCFVHVTICSALYWVWFTMELNRAKQKAKSATVHSMMCDELMKGRFREHLESEHNLENLEFILLCREFAHEADARERMVLGGKIMETHIRPNAPQSVTMPHTLVKELERALPKEGAPTGTVLPRDLFARAEHETMRMMSRDGWPRFQRKLMEGLGSFHIQHQHRREARWLVPRIVGVGLFLSAPFLLGVGLVHDAVTETDSASTGLDDPYLQRPSAVITGANAFFSFWTLLCCFVASKFPHDAYWLRGQLLCCGVSATIGVIGALVVPPLVAIQGSTILLSLCTAPLSVYLYRQHRRDLSRDNTPSRRESFLTQRPQTVQAFESWLVGAFSVSYLHFILDVEAALEPDQARKRIQEYDIESSPDPATSSGSDATLLSMNTIVAPVTPTMLRSIYDTYIVQGNSSSIELPTYISHRLDAVFAESPDISDAAVFKDAYTHVRGHLQQLWEDHVVEMALVKIRSPLQLTEKVLRLATPGRRNNDGTKRKKKARKAKASGRQQDKYVVPVDESPRVTEDLESPRPPSAGTLASPVSLPPIKTPSKLPALPVEVTQRAATISPVHGAAAAPASAAPASAAPDA